MADHLASSSMMFIRERFQTDKNRSDPSRRGERRIDGIAVSAFVANRAFGAFERPRESRAPFTGIRKGKAIYSSLPRVRVRFPVSSSVTLTRILSSGDSFPPVRSVSSIEKASLRFLRRASSRRSYIHRRKRNAVSSFCPIRSSFNGRFSRTISFTILFLVRYGPDWTEEDEEEEDGNVERHSRVANV